MGQSSLVGGCKYLRLLLLEIFRPWIVCFEKVKCRYKFRDIGVAAIRVRDTSPNCTNASVIKHNCLLYSIAPAFEAAAAYLSSVKSRNCGWNQPLTALSSRGARVQLVSPRRSYSIKRTTTDRAPKKLIPSQFACHGNPRDLGITLEQRDQCARGHATSPIGVRILRRYLSLIALAADRARRTDGERYLLRVWRQAGH